MKINRQFLIWSADFSWNQELREVCVCLCVFKDNSRQYNKKAEKEVIWKNDVKLFSLKTSGTEICARQKRKNKEQQAQKIK